MPDEATPHEGAEPSRHDKVSLGSVEDVVDGVSAPEGDAGHEATIGPDEIIPVKGTAVSVLVGGAIGLGISVAFFGLLWIALGHESKLYLFFWRDPWVPFFSTLLFFWAMAILVLKIKHIKREASAFTLNLLPSDPYQLLTIREVQSTLRDINRLDVDQKDLILVTRISRALRRVRAGNSSEIADFLEYQGGIDAAAVESTYAAVKIFIWAIPVVGFIGTVLGISVAIGNFGDLVQTAGDVEAIKAGLGPVTGGLAVAFETTLLALIYSIMVMFFSTYIQKREDDFMTHVEDHCVENLLNKLSIGDDKFVSELNEAFAEAQQESMQQQAHVVETALSELQDRQQQALEQVLDQIDQRYNESLTRMTEALQQLFDDMGGNQATRLSELGQRFERGLKRLGDTMEDLSAARDDGRETIAVATEFTRGDGEGGGDGAPDTGRVGQLLDAMNRQVQQLEETRDSIKALSQSLENLATLGPFQQLMGNIEKALDALVPAIDELKKPRELRVIDAHVPKPPEAES